MTREWPHAAFSGYGIEIEYMLVSRDTLDVLPIADRLLEMVGGAEDMDVERGEGRWSNELALHVIEIKTAGPARDLVRARDVLRAQVDEIRTLLQPLGATLLPTGMHPWMNPLVETKLWPHQNNEIYKTFDRIFDCKGHGWSNLQSTHINFPFQNDAEFEKVHAACRFVLPLLPALAGSSPFREGTASGALDTRLLAYRDNCRRVPSVTGRVIPEPVFSHATYEDLLQGIYADLSPHDPEGILAEEWVNARGCIARFDRGAVEIRLLDAQECPEQDASLVACVTSLVRSLAEGLFAPLNLLKETPTEFLAEILEDAIIRGPDATKNVETYAGVFGSQARTLAQLLEDICRPLIKDSPLAAGLDVILQHGPLGKRILSAQKRGRTLKDIYADLESCLARGMPYLVS